MEDKVTAILKLKASYDADPDDGIRGVRKRKIKEYLVTDTRKAAAKVKGKSYRMLLTEEGELIPRDPAYPLDGPGKIEKGKHKEKTK